MRDVTTGHLPIDDGRVGVVIPTVSQAAHLAECLAALRQHTTPSRIAIVVVLNGATPEVRDVARAAHGTRVIESAVNRGFAGGCQLGARHCDAPVLAFLNDDVRVGPGWLEPLLETLRDRPRAGAVAPRVLATDGTVQEIGSVIWRDGTTRPFGRGLPASSMAWRWRRRVDYASACALLVRREAWDRVGGFDEGYHPAYYEDVDFCLALDAAGYEVWVDPRADVVHAESASTTSAFKAFLFERHHARLTTRWGAALAARVPAPVRPADVPHAMRAAAGRLEARSLRVLVVDDRVPRHGIGSGFDRMADTVLALTEAGMSVRLLPTTTRPEFSPSLAAAGVEVLEDVREAALARELAASDVALVSRPNNATCVQQALRLVDADHRPRLVYDAEALYHRRFEREAGLRHGFTAYRARRAAAAWRAAESEVAAHADAIVCVSDDEAAYFIAQGARSVHVRLPWLRKASLTPGGLHGRADIGFVAGWLAGAASPNGDALEWFVTEVLPRVTAVMPWVRLRVTGQLPESLRRFEGLHVRSEGVVGDLAGFYASLRVAVVPLRYGAGVKLKTVEALQYGVPVVATTIGAEGLGTLPAGVVAIHDEPGAFASAVLHRLWDVGAWRRQRRAIEEALRRADTHTDWPALLTGSPKEDPRVHRAI